MSLKMTTQYKGLTIPDAVYTVEEITISGARMSFYVSMKANTTSETISGEVYGCSYDSSGDTPETQAYTYLKTLDEFSSATEI